jgi:hypothetical protein
MHKLISGFYIFYCVALLLLPLTCLFVKRPGWWILAILINVGFWGYQLMAMSGIGILTIF